MASTIPRTIPFIIGSTASVVTAPTAITAFTAAARLGGAQLTWGGATGATSYLITATGGPVPRQYTFSGTTGPIALQGLSNGVLYTLTMVARNDAGSTAAVTTTVTPSAAAILPGSDGTLLLSPAPIAPVAPVISTVTPFDGAAVVSWSPPVDDGGSGVTGYGVSAAAADGTVALTFQVSAAANSANLAPLVNGVLYSVTVTAINGVGTSPPSAPVTVTPVSGGTIFIPPDAPAPAHVPVLQPRYWAFPADRVFHPNNWLLSTDEVDAQ